jgi:hypothetical protein
MNAGRSKALSHLLRLPFLFVNGAPAFFDGVFLK